MSDVHFRKLQNSDFESIIEIIDEIKDKQSTYGFNWNRQKLLSEFAIAKCFILEKACVPIAFLAVRELAEADEIVCVAVQASQRQLGYGQKIILDFLSSRADQRNDAPGQGREVWLEVHEKNLPAIKLYQNLGFVTVGNRSNYYPDGGKAILLSFPPPNSR